MSEQKRTGRPPYPPEVRERAVRMVFDHQDEYSSQWKAVESVSAKLGINHETLRIWVRRAETDAGKRPGLTTDERQKMRELERENKELRRANEIGDVFAVKAETPRITAVASASFRLRGCVLQQSSIASKGAHSQELDRL